MYSFSREHLRRVFRKKASVELRLIYISAHLHICASSHLYIYIFTSAHLHLHISHLRILSLFFFFLSQGGSGAAGAPRNVTLCGDCARRGREAQVRLRFGPVGATLCGDRARRGREMQVRLRFGPVRRNPLRRSCVSRARNAGDCVLDWSRFTFGGSLVRNARLETWRFTFGGSSARFGDLAPHFWRKSRTKRSFWRLGASLLEVSYEALVLETWRCTFGGSLVRNAGFGDLALWRFTFGGSLVRNAHFGDLALHLWSWTQTWPVCSSAGKSLWELDSEAFRSWIQAWPVCSANVVRERAFWSWTQKWSVSS